MLQHGSQTQSSAYRAAKEKLAAMSQEELASHKLELARQRAARERAAILAMRERTVRGRIEASGIPGDYRSATITLPRSGSGSIRSSLATQRNSCSAGPTEPARQPRRALPCSSLRTT